MIVNSNDSGCSLKQSNKKTSGISQDWCKYYIYVLKGAHENPRQNRANNLFSHIVKPHNASSWFLQPFRASSQKSHNISDDVHPVSIGSIKMIIYHVLDVMSKLIIR